MTEPVTKDILDLAGNLVSLKKFSDDNGLSQVAVRKYIRDGILPAYRCGSGRGRICIDRRDIAKLITPVVPRSARGAE